MTTARPDASAHALRYANVITPEGQDALSRIARRIAPGSTVLDVGTGPGALGHHLAERGCAVDGLDADAAQAALARAFYRTFVLADLEADDLGALLGAERYDVIVCADVLEHLRDPGRALDALVPLLKAGGRLLVSTPNIGYAGVVAALLSGEFPYRPTGILDETHVKFFTRRSLIALLREHGLGARALEAVTCPVSESEFRAHDPQDLAAAPREAVLSAPDALTYQFVVEAEPGVETPLELASPPRATATARARVYWCAEGEGFGEERSAAGEQVAEGRLRFALPAAVAGASRLRLDVDDRPGLFRVDAIRLLAGSGAEVASWSGEALALARARSQQLVDLAVGGERWWFAIGDDPAFEIPADAAALHRAAGGRVEVDVRAALPRDLAAAQRHLGDELRAARDRADALAPRAAEAQRLAAEGQRLAATVHEQAARIAALDATARAQSERLAELTRATPLRLLAREVRRMVRAYACTLAPEAPPGAAEGSTRLRLVPTSGRLPAGWVELDFELESADGDTLRPALWADDGSGRLTESPTPFPPLVDGRARGIVKLPDRVTDLYLDALVEPGQYRVGQLRVRELARVAAAPRLAAPVALEQLRDPRRLLGTAREGYRVYRAEGWSVLKRRFRDAVASRKGPRDYAAWVRECDALSAGDRERIARRSAALAARHALGVVLLLGERDAEDDLAATLASLDAQLYPRWRGVVVAATPRAARRARALAADGRWSGPVARGDGFASRLDGTAALFVRPGEVLAPHAFYVVAETFEGDPQAELVYGDEDALDGDARAAPFFKPDWSPYRLWCQDYVRHRVACRVELLRRVGLPARLDGEPVFDLLLRAERAGAAAHHVPFVLCHARSQAPRDLAAATAALEEHLRAVAPGATVEPGALPETLRVRPALPAAAPLVSIVIPTRNRVELLRACIESIRGETDYPRFELVVVDNGSDEPEARRYLDALAASGDARVLAMPGEFNYPALNAAGVAAARGEVLALLNNDIEVHDRGWLREMVGWALRDDVGAVGCRLRYGDGRVQHVGIVLGMGGLAGHVHRQLAPGEPGRGGAAWVLREVGAVTAACLVLRRAVWDEVGGMDGRLRVAFNDVDLCLRIRERGRAVLFTPFADLLHLESATRGDDAAPEKRARLAAEADLVLARHGSAALVDPYYSPNLSLDATSADLAFPPRAAKPWRLDHSRRPRLAFLTYRLMKGYGVDVVVAEQVEFLCARGYDVTVLVLEKDASYDARLEPYRAAGQLRVVRVRSAEEAVAKVLAIGARVAVAHTPPFHAVLPRLPATVLKVLFDHGEPPADLFPDAPERRRIAEGKVAASRQVDLSIAISDFVRADSGLAAARLCRNGNDHLLRRRSNLARLAGTFRAAHGLGDAFVVLNVTRYLAGERLYKGVGQYAAVREALLRLRPELEPRVRFVLAGRGDEADRRWAAERGLVALSNLADDELVAAYLDADLYLSMSQWEGYNLGAAQALALGVPTLASARGAHPELPIRTSDDPEAVARWIAEAVDAAGRPPEPRAPLRRLRTAHVAPWKRAAANLEALVREGLEARGLERADLPPALAGADAAPPPEVSFLILNKDRPDLLTACVRSIEERCDVPYEILIGDTGSTDPATLRFYEGTRHEVHHLGFYNFSACNNVLAARARAPRLLFLNNDTELIRADLRQALDYLAAHRDVGCLGAYLVYPDRRIQHAGVRICPDAPYRGIPEHFDKLKPIDGYPGLAAPRDVVAVTGAMLLVDAEVFWAAGGLDEVYEEEAQDIDLCLRLRQKGLRSVMHPALHAYHRENATRTVKEAPRDRAEFLRRFGRVIDEELYAWQASAGLG